MASALRFGAILRRGLYPGSVVSRRAYSNGVDRIPLTFASPTKAFYDNVNVKQVDVCSTTGNFGILPMHVPSIAVLKPGLVTVYEEDKTVKYFAMEQLHSGKASPWLRGKSWGGKVGETPRLRDESWGKKDWNKATGIAPSSGSVTVNADSTVQILAEEAVPLEQLDAQATRQGLEKCQQQLASASTDAERAEANVGIELHEAVIKALEG